MITAKMAAYSAYFAFMMISCFVISDYRILYSAGFEYIRISMGIFDVIIPL